MTRRDGVDSAEAIEELVRLQNEFGVARLKVPDPIEAQWRNDVDRMEFDSETQTILLVSDA